MKSRISQLIKNVFHINKKLENKISFSQEAEDLVLSELAQFNKCYDGLYVDVGAHHPLRFSNTAIYHQRGWRGVNIDATPGSMSEFQRLRPKDINLECAVSNDCRERLFYIYNEPALNGIDNDQTSKFQGSRYKLIDTIPVQTLPLKAILEKHFEKLPQSNFLTVDAEGHDLKVLQSNCWNRFRFHWILCELKLNKISEIASDSIYQYLHGLGYELKAFTGRTGIFRDGL